MEVSECPATIPIFYSSRLSLRTLKESLATPQEYTLQGGEEVTTKILILKGQGNSLRFDPVRLFLRSACTADSYDPAVVYDIAWNQEISDEGIDSDSHQRIVFTPPCPQIHWAGQFAEERQMVFSRETLVALSDLVEVSIFNVVSSVEFIICFTCLFMAV